MNIQDITARADDLLLTAATDAHLWAWGKIDPEALEITFNLALGGLQTVYGPGSHTHPLIALRGNFRKVDWSDMEARIAFSQSADEAITMTLRLLAENF